MKLIEKKCPNCSASLEFKENDKNCQAVYYSDNRKPKWDFTSKPKR